MYEVRCYEDGPAEIYFADSQHFIVGIKNPDEISEREFQEALQLFSARAIMKQLDLWPTDGDEKILSVLEED